ncbi:MAG: hypothetical protein ACT4QF_19660 [Sporichthyaceae bacterium]
MGQRRSSPEVKTPAPGSRRLPAAAAVRDALFAGLLTLLLAPWFGLAWERLAPAPAYVNIEGSVFPKDEDSSEFIAADVWFLGLGLLLGLACGVMAYLRYRRALPTMVLVLVAAVVGAFLARGIGEQLGPIDLAQAALGTVDGERVEGALELRSNIALLGWPIGVLIAYVSMILGLEKPAPRVDGAASVAEEDENSVQAGGSAGEGGSGNGRQPGKDGSLARQER